MNYLVMKTKKTNLIWIDEFLCLRSKAYSFKCKGSDDASKSKLKGVSKSQSKHIKLEECRICLDGKENQKECNNSILKSWSLNVASKDKKNLHYLFSMIKEIKQIMMKVVYLRINTTKWFQN